MFASSARALLRPVLALAPLFGLLARPAEAATLVFSDLAIVVQSEIRSERDGPSAHEPQRIADGLVLPPGSSAEFETLIEPTFTSSFPTSPSRLPAGFISAAMNTNLDGAVGISGVGPFGEVWEATAKYSQSVTNRTAPGEAGVVLPVRVSVAIPAGEVSYWTGGTDPTDFYLRNAAQLSLTLVEHDEHGTPVRFEELFFHVALIFKEFPGDGLAGLRSIIEFSDVANARVYEAPDPNRAGEIVAGIRWDAFTSTFVYDLDPDHTFSFEYDMLAFGSTDIANASTVLDDRVYGHQVLVGDPFNISGANGGGGIRLSPVPEPAAAALLGLGLCGLFCWGRARQGD